MLMTPQYSIVYLEKLLEPSISIAPLTFLAMGIHIHAEKPGSEDVITMSMGTRSQ